MSQSASFDARVRRIGKRSARIRENGYIGRIDKTGLITMHPRRKGPAFPLRGVLIVFLVAFAFKGAVLAVLGPDDYSARLDRLSSGTVVEQGGAWLMQPDPASLALASALEPMF